jgi:hypothetical protein
MPGVSAVTPPTIVFVHLGADLPAWLATTLEQSRIFNSCPILLVAGSAALARASIPQSLQISTLPLEETGLSEKHRTFRRVAPFDRQFREGFWTFTSERFFVLESAMQKLSLQNVIHLENDVMLYCSVADLMPHLSRLYQGIAATFDNDTRCVPGIVYLPNQRSIAALTDFYLHVLQQLAHLPDIRGLNDMQVLGALRQHGRALIDHLPIVPPDYPGALRSAAGHVASDPACYSRNFESLGLIFDAAALGQFLGGIDPRNQPGTSVGFVNESCVFDPRVLRPSLVRDSAGRLIPVVETASGVHRVANLHVHSKNAVPFLSRPKQAS